MARVMHPQRPAADANALLRPVLVVLAAATVIEFVLLRTVTRTAMHIPDIQALETPYSIVADTGRYAYFVAATSLVATLFLFAITIPGRRDARSWAGGFAVVVFVAVAILARVGEAPVAVTAVLAVAAVAGATSAAVAYTPRVALMAIPVAIAFALGAAYTVAQATGGTNLTWLHASAEIPAVAAALAAPAAFRVPLRGRTLAVAVAAGVLAFVVFAGNPSTSRILLLWNGGLSGAFPGVVYAFAAASAAGALAGLWREGRWFAVLAMILFATAGVGVENTYQTGLLVCALLLLTSPTIPTATPGVVSQPVEV